MSAAAVHPDSHGIAMDADDFALFGLPRRFALDPAELHARWKALQSQVHPDRFAAAGPDARRLALQWSVRVNEAHRCLKDPMARATALCALNGHPVDADRALPAGFLVQQLVWREALEAAATVAQVEAVATEVADERARRLAELAALIDEAAAWADAALNVRALMFLARLAVEVDGRLDR